MTLTQLGSSYLGQVLFPARVSDFKPGYVDQIVVRVGPAPTVAQQQAALDLVAKLTRSYRPVPVRIDIDTSAGPLPPGPPARRVIELREGAEPLLEVQNPSLPDAFLLITGRGEELSEQVQLFADRRVELAQAPSAAVNTAATQVPRATTVKTFAQLAMAGEVSVLGTETLYVGFDAAEFGFGQVQQAAVRILAHYTPVSGGEASVVVRAGNTVLGARRLDESGLLDMTGTIPPESIQSTVGIALQLRYLPGQRCAPLNDRMQFTLDPQSSVAVTPGSRNRGGFLMLPMGFTPEFAVALDDPNHIGYAAQAINLLAQHTAVTLQPRLSSVPDALHSGLGALVVAPGEVLAAAGLTPPMLSRGVDSVDVVGATSTDVDLNGPVGVIQAFGSGGRTVLSIEASEDWSLVDRCFEHIRAQPSRWASLTGDVVAAGPAGQTVNLTLREGGALVDEFPGEGWQWWSWATLGSVVTALLIAGGSLLRRNRLRRLKAGP